MSSLRTMLILGRAANLPTVWSNCLAGWWLGGGGNVRQLPPLFAGASFLYLGGAFLNDAMDAKFDREYRHARPIPAGLVSLPIVLRWAVAWLVLGLLCLFWLGKFTGILGLALVLCIVLYDALHRVITFSPVFLGLCRFCLYVIAASVSTNGVTGWPLWCGLVLAAYVAGARWLTGREQARKPIRYWPLPLLAIPIFLALLMDMHACLQGALALSAVLALWVARSLRPALWSEERDLESAATGLTAGIVFVDWVAIADAPRPLSVVFLVLFGLTLLGQRLIPER
jgi:4-hydroxybenzoate polyprenyltransferase